MAVRSLEAQNSPKIPSRDIVAYYEPSQAQEQELWDAVAIEDQVWLSSTDANYTSISKADIRAIDLFSGCGGLSLGLTVAARKAGLAIEFALAVEQHEAAAQVYVDNFAPKQIEKCDIASIFAGTLGALPTSRERELAARLQHIDILLAGPPCQGFSDLNNYTRRRDDRNDLYLRAIRCIEITLPDSALIENVPFVTKDRLGVVQISEKHLKDMGYFVDSGVVDLSTIGAPQKRLRHVLIASKLKGITVDAITQFGRVERSRTVRWAIENLEERYDAASIFDSSSEASRRNLARMRYLLRQEVYDLPNDLRPFCHHGEHSYRAMYGRLKYDQPSPTITQGFGSMGQGRYVHPNFPRTLTPHETARLQMFPDSFDFSSAKSRGHLAMLIGNAAPMNLSAAFFKGILAGCNAR